MKNKKMKTLLIAGAMMIATLSSAYAAGVTKNIKVNWNSLSVYVSGKKVTGDNIVYNGVTYVPLRSVSSGLNKNTTYDGKAKTIKITDKEKLYTQKQVTQMISKAEKDLEGAYNDLGTLSWEFDYYETIYNYYVSNNSDFKLAVLDIQHNGGFQYTEIKQRIDDNLTAIRTYLDYTKQNQEGLNEIFVYFGGEPGVLDNIILNLETAYTHSMNAKTVLENIKSGQELDYNAINIHLDNVENNATSVINDIYTYNEILHETIATPVSQMSVEKMNVVLKN